MNLMSCFICDLEICGLFEKVFEDILSMLSSFVVYIEEVSG
jgi:hypothetical protein